MLVVMVVVVLAENNNDGDSQDAQYGQYICNNEWMFHDAAHRFRSDASLAL